MVSHIDDDHVAGLLELARKLNDQRESGQPLPWKIRRFWHNSFDDILDNDDLAGRRRAASTMNTASLGDFLAPEGSLILASVRQGRELRKLLDALTLGGNPPFKGLVLTAGAAKAVTVGDLKITVVAPRKTELHGAAEEVEQGDQADPEEGAEPGAAGRGGRLRRQVGAQPVEHRRPRRVAGEAHAPDRRRPRRPHARGLEGGEAPEGRQASRRRAEAPAPRQRAERGRRTTSRRSSPSTTSSPPTASSTIPTSAR